MTKTRQPAALTLTVTDSHAAVTLAAPGAPGVSVSRTGEDERTAIAASLRGLADTLEANRREERRAGETTWVRMSILVDVEVSVAEAARMRVCEERVNRGSVDVGAIAAAEESLGIATRWMATAQHDNDARRWIAFDWSPVDECLDPMEDQ